MNWGKHGLCTMPNGACQLICSGLVKPQPCSSGSSTECTTVACI